MRLKLLIGILVVLTMMLTSCSKGNVVKEPTCKSPYIEFKAGECCLDQNSNSVCDNDEKPAEPIVKETPKEEPKPEPALITFSVADAKSAVTKLYKGTTIFKDNGLKPNKPYNGTTLSYVNVYDSNYVTIVEIKDNSKSIKTDDQLKTFINDYENSQIVDRTIPIDEKGRPLIEYKLQVSSNFIEDSNNRLVDYRYWAKVYEIYYGNYVAKKFTTPIGDAYIYVKCAPNLILIIYSNDYAGLATSWGSLSEQDYEGTLDNSLATRYNGAIEEAQSLLKECP